VGEAIRHALAEALSRGEAPDPALERHTISVLEVRMSPDLRQATIYVMPLGGRDQAQALEALNRNARALRAAISARLADLKFAPQLHFRLDERFDAAARIDALFRDARVQRDLAAPEAPDPDAER
jgi:ribosome-binding factor A